MRRVLVIVVALIGAAFAIETIALALFSLKGGF